MVKNDVAGLPEILSKALAVLPQAWPRGFLAVLHARDSPKHRILLNGVPCPRRALGAQGQEPQAWHVSQHVCLYRSSITQWARPGMVGDGRAGVLPGGRGLCHSLWPGEPRSFRVQGRSPEQASASASALQALVLDPRAQMIFLPTQGQPAPVGSLGEPSASGGHSAGLPQPHWDGWRRCIQEVASCPSLGANLGVPWPGKAGCGS